MRIQGCSKVLSTIEEIKIYSDPYRIQIMNMFNKRGRASTVKEIADQMGEVLAKVHYHVKKLEKIGLLTIVSTREIRLLRNTTNHLPERSISVTKKKTRKTYH